MIEPSTRLGRYPVAFLRPLMQVLFPGRGAGKLVLLNWTLHLVFWGGLAAGGWQIQQAVGLERWLRSPWPMLHPLWLPLLIVLLYALSRLGFGLWQALGPFPTAQTCPEIHAAWQEAELLLEQAGRNVQDLPCFLLLGPWTPAGSTLIEAVGATRLETSLRASPTVPWRLFTHPEALLVHDSGAEKVSGPFGTKKNPDTFSAGQRLQEWCRQLERARPGQPPLQGIVLMVPLAALRSESLVQETITRCQANLQAIRQATGREFPLHVALTGLADSADAVDRNHLPAGIAGGWFQRFPLTQDCLPEEMTLSLKEGIEHLCLERLPRLVRQHLQFEAAPVAAGTLTDALRANRRQYQFLASVPTWQASLCRLLTEGTWNEYEEPGRVAGCYFLPDTEPPAAAGATAAGATPSARESTALQALLSDLFDHRAFVTWTPEAQAEHEQQQQWTRKGYGLVMAGWLSMLMIALGLLTLRW